MKIVIAPMSALAGAAALGLVLIAVGATQGHEPLRVRVVHPVDVVGIPDPRDIIVIEAGFPYLVPAGKLFVLTAFGSSGGRPSSVTLGVDGTTVFGLYNGSGPYFSMHRIPPHYTVAPGSTVTTGGRAWGYLIEA